VTGVRRGRHSRADGIDPFTDLLFNVLLIFTFLFLMAIVFMNPPARTGAIDLKAEYIVTVKWPDHSPDDIDTWVRDPDGRVVWFRNTEDGFMHLDRDDRGLSNDTILVDGEKVVNPLNQEVVTVRRLVPGEYIVNLHYYKSVTEQPVAAEVSVARVNPSLDIFFYGKVVLERAGAERTAVRFNLGRDGSVADINTLPKALVSIKAEG